MTTIPLQFKLTLATLVGQLSEVAACYLDRPYAIGDNEAKPIVNIREVSLRAGPDSSHTVTTWTMELAFECFYDIQPDGPGISVLSDPLWDQLHNLLTGPTVRDLPAMSGVTVQAREQSRPDSPQGYDAGRVDFFYSFIITNYNADLTTSPYA